MISFIKKFLFIHVPKTAGRSIKEKLALQGVDKLGLVLLGHLPVNKIFDSQGEINTAPITKKMNILKKLKYYRKEKRKNARGIKGHYYRDLVLNSENRISKLKGLKIDDFFKFSVTRNPWDRMVSTFLQQDRIEHKLIRRKYPQLANRKSIDFETYCELAIEQRDYNYSSLSRMKDKNNEVKMDFVLKFENLEKDWISICNSISIDHQPLPWVGKAPNTKFDTYQKYYNSNTKKIIKNNFEEDIEYFKYTF